MKWLKRWCYILVFMGTGIVYLSVVDHWQVYAEPLRQVQAWYQVMGSGGEAEDDGSTGEESEKCGIPGGSNSSLAGNPEDGGGEGNPPDYGEPEEGTASGSLAGSGNGAGSPDGLTGSGNAAGNPDGVTGSGNTAGNPDGVTGSGNAAGTPGGAMGSGNAAGNPGDATGSGNTVGNPGGATGSGNAAGSPGGATGSGNAAGIPGGATGSGNTVGNPGGVTGSGNSAGEQELPEVQYMTVEDDYFSDAVFIGDSRTVGMFEYGGLEEISSFYASTGLTVYKMFDSEIVTVPGERKKITVEEALQQNSFTKIYLMIGINEMGTGTVESFLEKYQEVVAHLQELQPDAIIYLQAIMKVTAERSAKGDYITNEGITARNEGIAKLADNRKIFFLDVNPEVCDDTGGMIPDYTFDGVHLKAKFIQIWKDYLKTHAISS